MGPIAIATPFSTMLPTTSYRIPCVLGKVGDLLINSANRHRVGAGGVGT